MKMIRKIIAIMMALVMMAGVGAFASEEVPTANSMPILGEAIEIPAKEPAEGEPASEEPAEEEPAESEPVSEEPAEEEPAESEPVSEEPVEEAPAGEEAVEEETAEEPSEEFAGEVYIELKNSGDIYFGDVVTLKAVIANTNMAYSISWEVNSGNGWIAIPGATAGEYSFEVTEENAGYEYRVVLTAEV